MNCIQCTGTLEPYTVGPVRNAPTAEETVSPLHLQEPKAPSASKPFAPPLILALVGILVAVVLCVGIFIAQNIPAWLGGGINGQVSTQVAQTTSARLSYCGFVKDSQTNQPVADAAITIRFPTYLHRGKTNPDGYFTVQSISNDPAQGLEIETEAYLAFKGPISPCNAAAPSVVLLTPLVTPILPATRTPFPTAVTLRAPFSIRITNRGFEPPAARVSVNSTVIWENRTTDNVTVTSGVCNVTCTPFDLFNSGTLSPGSTFQFTFTAAGSYGYYSAHDMRYIGVVVVEP